MEPGATGEFPDGKLTESDEGELKMLFRQYKGKIVIEFGKPVYWLAMRPIEAKQFADLLLKHAAKLESGNI